MDSTVRVGVCLRCHMTGQFPFYYLAQIHVLMYLMKTVHLSFKHSSNFLSVTTVQGSRVLYVKSKAVVRPNFNLLYFFVFNKREYERKERSWLEKVERLAKRVSQLFAILGSTAR